MQVQPVKIRSTLGFSQYFSDNLNFVWYPDYSQRPRTLCINYTPNVNDFNEHSVSDNVVFKKIFYLKITVSTVINAADIKYPLSID